MINDIKLKEIADIIEANLKAPKWVFEARETNTRLRALKYGERYSELLINRVEGIENEKRAIARKKYSIDIRDLCHRVLQPREAVFFANGSVEHFTVTGKQLEIAKECLDNFKDDKPADKYFQETYFELSDIDPNGLIFIEYLTNESIKSYPTYKSIQDIRAYKSKSQKLEWVLFEPTKDERGNEIFRFVDSEVDVHILKRKKQYEVIVDLSFVNVFNEVPAVILSPIEKIGTEIRWSWLYFVEDLLKEYSRGKSILTIYKKLQGFPKHWRYAQACGTCKGTKKVDGQICKTCNGTGEPVDYDVTDDIKVMPPKNKESDIVLAPNFSGYSSPDLNTAVWLKDENESIEDKIYMTLWGATKEKNQTGAETATGRFIDEQPKINRLNVFTSAVEYAYNSIVNYKISLHDLAKEDKNKKSYVKTFGRRYILDTFENLLKSYIEAKKNEVSTEILDGMLEEMISAKYKTDPKMRDIELNYVYCEPYPHSSIKTVMDVFGFEEAQRKILYQEWKKQSDKNLTKEQLLDDFDKWFNLKKQEYVQRREAENSKGSDSKGVVSENGERDSSEANRQMAQNT